MKRDKQTINVFIDTQVFDTQNYDLKNRTFQQLLALKDAGAIRVYSTEVTRREIERHLNTRAGQIFHLLEKLRKHPLVRFLDIPSLQGIHQATSIEAIQTHLRNQFKEYSKALGIKELAPPPDTLQRVLDKYFNIEPPFGTGDKKAEFPDAVAAEAILAWCKQKKAKMYIVSADGDWKSVCENDKCLIHREKIAELLDEFPDPAVAQAIKDAIMSDQDQIGHGFESELAGCVLDAPTADFIDIREVKIGAVTLEDIFIINASDGFAAVEVDLVFDFEATLIRDQTWVEITAPSRFGTRTYIAKGKEKATGAMYLTYDESEPCEIDIDWQEMLVTSSTVRVERWIDVTCDTPTVSNLNRIYLANLGSNKPSEDPDASRFGR